VELLRQRARPYLFSNSVAPAIVGASLKVFDILLKSPTLKVQLNENTKRFRSGMKAAGFKILGHDDVAICPVWLGDAKLATEFADEMLKEDIYVIGFSYPVVPKDQARIRVQLSASHTPEQIDKAVTAFIQIGKRLGVISAD